MLDFLRQRRAAPGHVVLDDRDDERQAATIAPVSALVENDEGEEVADLYRMFLLDEAEKVQAAVKARVKPQTWDAFWLVAVCDWKVEQTAAELGLTHTAVYAARERVARMLREEGQRTVGR